MFSCQNILTATGGRLIGGGCRTIKGVSIDSRAIKRGECFVAIKGERFDGHDFLREAVKNGAAGLVVSRDVPRRISSRTGAAIFRVNDTLRALGDIAHFHRMRFDIPVVAITGSNGKTTAKEMVAAVLRNGWRPLKSAGTENNLIGVPLTLLRMNGRHGSAVLEFGMNRAGEIARLAEIAAPNIGVIMNVASAHSGFFRDIGAIFRAKKELFDAVVWIEE